MLIKGTAYQSFSVAMYLIGSNTQIRIMYFQNASEILSNAMIEKDPASIISGAILYTYTGFLVMHPEMQVSIYGHAIPFLQ
jgi:hypothetical protein